MRKHYRVLATALALLVFALALPASGAEPKAEAKRVVNINAADAAQLGLLPHVGPSLAQKIIDYRKKRGPFKTVEDVLLVRGIGDKSFQLLRPYLSISGETTLKEKVHGEKPPKAKEGAH